MDGILIVNKPKGITSNDVVNKIKHVLNCKVGHTGTLDPNATGVLPLLLGNGTKFSKYLINHDKIYCATIKLGEKTSTADTEGEVIETRPVKLHSEGFIDDTLKQFVGKQVQTPPIYSAIKVNGKKLYEYARKGEEVEIPKREIEIYEINLVNYEQDNSTITFKVHCSKGTYIRTLCEDISEKLGTVGYMEELQRLKVGSFDISSAVDIFDVENNKNNEEWLKSNIVGLEDLLLNYPSVEIKEQNELDRFLNGVKVGCNCQDGICRAYFKNEFIGSGIVFDNKIKRDVILK
ncbi:MAG: tRNA pseudouridine(55) synthase TruB [Clostridia bacterium]|nr:tRNA pseudouridine(55) synthase TruB [Clostridia bacterium]